MRKSIPLKTLRKLIAASVFSGGGRPKLVEPRGVTVCREFGIQWKRPEIDLAELEQLRLVNNWKTDKLAEHFGCGQSKIKQHLREASIRCSKPIAKE